jgi:outer membrane protein TolC
MAPTYSRVISIFSIFLRRHRVHRLPIVAFFAAHTAGIASAQSQPASAPPPEAPHLPEAGATEIDDAGLEKVTFDSSVRRALSRNPTALQAREEIERAHALMEETRADSLPVLNGVGTYTRLDGDRVVGGAIVQPAGSLNANATLSAPLVYPRGWVRWGQASEQIDVARAKAADVRRTVAVATARAYLTIITQKRLVETARIARDNAKAHYDFTHAQRVGGVGNRLDEARAAQELTTEEVNLQNQAVALLKAREALGVLVAAPGPVDTADESIPSQMPSFQDAMNQAQTERADVKARERAAKAADRTVRDSWADYGAYDGLAGATRPHCAAL